MNALAELMPGTSQIRELRGQLRHDVSMAEYVSWRAGGRAEMMYEPADSEDLVCFLQQLPLETPVYWLGLGSNLLVRDGGLSGVVIRTHGALRELRLEQMKDGQGSVYAEAGVALPKVARYCASHDLTGAEFMAGIPGTVGGALAMNAGCYGGETWRVTEQVMTVDKTGQVRMRKQSEFHIGYREVEAKCREQQEWFLGAYFLLPVGDGRISRAKITELLRSRVASQPLGQANAGSVFRNPEGDHAARLIEACGLKGKQLGGAQISMKHANFIVNIGQATASEIEELMTQVKEIVAQQTGIHLVHEVRIIGERTGVSV
ncbi:MAG: UDP-N-acetylmuramate dehydrogenase [Betaproteobacteria bacterium]|nr:UDP-N-acetylmuramate dehydrogenase [Betaproteobacteria bacterium]